MPKGEKVIFEGILYKDGDKVSFKKDDIYKSKGGKEVAESTVTETVATETVSQATQSGIQVLRKKPLKLQEVVELELILMQKFLLQSIQIFLSNFTTH